MVHKDKVVEIYNMQNEEKVHGYAIDKICKERWEELADGFVEIYGDYFVEVSIIEFDEFEELLCEEIQFICRSGFSMNGIFDIFNQRNINLF